MNIWISTSHVKCQCICDEICDAAIRFVLINIYRRAPLWPNWIVNLLTDLHIWLTEKKRHNPWNVIASASKGAQDEITIIVKFYERKESTNEEILSSMTCSIALCVTLKCRRELAFAVHQALERRSLEGGSRKWKWNFSGFIVRKIKIYSSLTTSIFCQRRRFYCDLSRTMMSACTRRTFEELSHLAVRVKVNAKQHELINQINF